MNFSVPDFLQNDYNLTESASKDVLKQSDCISHLELLFFLRSQKQDNMEVVPFLNTVMTLRGFVRCVVVRNKLEVCSTKA